MKKNFETEIMANFEIAEKIFCLEVYSPELSKISKAGQFVEVQLSEEFTLRRPFGIASTKNDTIKIFYRVVGHGTDFLSRRNFGEILNVLGPLGNGFDTDIEGKVLLVGGGMGLAPLLSAAEKLNYPDILMGGKNADEVMFWEREFVAEVDAMFVMTDDGSLGEKGFVTNFLPEILKEGKYSAVFTCGPEIMMKNVALEVVANDIPCQVSFERRMACGLGACLSCSIDTTGGRKKVCKDGPIFNATEVFEECNF